MPVVPLFRRSLAGSFRVFLMNSAFPDNDPPQDFADIVIEITLDAELRLENEEVAPSLAGVDVEIEPDLLKEFLRRRTVQEVKTFCQTNAGLLNEVPGVNTPVVYLIDGELIENDETRTLRLSGTMSLAMPKSDWLRSGLQGQRRRVREAAQFVEDYSKRHQPLLTLPKVGGSLTFIDMSFDLDRVSIEED